ncbi:MAG TPA: hybrid sensor histidine kinase/response regulator [Candidatus Marinimicrobia bacterium]|nr:hybrid sensor histidine kinase/response regulator [Candidatus Neomarinimicrobiota bacterium]
MFKGDVLIIDDSLSFCESVQDMIQDEEAWHVEFVTNGESGLKKLSEEEWRVVLLDLKMPGMSGLDVLSTLNEQNRIGRNYIIVLTGEITIENAVDSLQFGARDFIQKPAVVEFPEIFMERIKKGFCWQEERLINDKLRHEKQKAIEESQLIVKSVGHDMSGSYYGSLMLRLQTLRKKLQQTGQILDQNIIQQLFDPSRQNSPETFEEDIRRVQALIINAVERSDGIIELMKFFRELGEKLKHLGNAISIDRSHDQQIELSAILRSALHVFADSKIHENPQVRIEENYAADPLWIMASEEDLIRVFLNLLENAYKAMDGEGVLTLRTFVQNGEAIAEVSDTGCGIPEDKIDKIWRPDFTSWKNTTGTGLGLLICRKAVENSDGKITVASKEGQGTTFILTFKRI